MLFDGRDQFVEFKLLSLYQMLNSLTCIHRPWRNSIHADFSLLQFLTHAPDIVSQKRYVQMRDRRTG